MSRFAIGCASLALAIGTSAAPVAATSFNAFTSFDGTQGAGNFYYGELQSGTYTPLPTCFGLFFPTAGCLGSSGYPNFAKAASPGPHSGVIMPMDRLVTHTPWTGAGIITWVAPVAGDYRIDAVFSALHPQAELGNGIGITGFFEESGEAAQPGPRVVRGTTELAVSLVRSFGAGDRYGFALDSNGDASYDLSSVNMVATLIPSVGGVPEPATWGLLIAGFGLVGSAARRRRMATSVS